MEVAAPPAIMKEKHLRVSVRGGGRMLKLKAFQFAERAAEFEPGARLDIAFALEPDPWSASRGYTPWSATLRDVRPARG